MVVSPTAAIGSGLALQAEEEEMRNQENERLGSAVEALQEVQAELPLW